MGRSIESLPVDIRARHYRDSAAEAFRLAEKADNPGLRAAYLSVATGWHSMALELEFLLKSSSIFDEMYEEHAEDGGP
jgi:hypothetical protein